MQRVAMLSVHTSPLAQPGTGDGGGMNVYVRCARLGARARRCRGRRAHPRRASASSRRWSSSSPVSGCCTSTAGRARRSHATCSPISSAPFSEAARRADRTRGADYDVLHANYWVSGAVGHRLKHELDLPLVTTFHTLDRVKAEVGLDDDVALRPRVEAEVVRCADLVVASTDRGARAARPLLRRRSRSGRDRPARCRPPRVLARRPRRGTRRELGLADRPVAAVRRSHPAAQGRRSRGRRARRSCTTRVPSLVIVGGPSGPDGDAELAHLHSLVHELGSGATRALRRPAAARTARRLLPRRRRVRRAVAHRVVRARRARGGRVRHAGRRRQRRRSALRSSTTARPATSSTDAIRSTSPRRSIACSRRGRGARSRARTVGAVGALPLEHRGGAAAPSLRRPRGRASRCSAARRSSASPTGVCSPPPTSSSPRTSKVRSRTSRTSSTSSTTPSCGAGTCASRATAATRPRSTSTCTSARCATRSTSCPIRPANHARALRVPAAAQPLDVRRALLARARRRRLPRRPGRARAPERRRARSHHRRALRAHRALVPARRSPRLRATSDDVGLQTTTSCVRLCGTGVDGRRNGAGPRCRRAVSVRGSAGSAPSVPRALPRRSTAAYGQRCTDHVNGRSIATVTSLG